MTTMTALERAKMLIGRTPLPVPPMRVQRCDDEDQETEYHVVDSTGRSYLMSHSKLVAEDRREYYDRRYTSNARAGGEAPAAAC